MNINAETRAYIQTLQHFAISNRLSRRLFEKQDHLAFKAYNSDDYAGLLERFKPMSYQISEIWQADRRLAVARLMAGHSIDMTMDFSTSPSIVRWVELMEAKPDDQSDRPPRLDHTEVYFRSLTAMRGLLRMSKVPFTDQENDSHAWVSVQISEAGDELKFTDTPLERIVKEEIANGSARIL